MSDRFYSGYLTQPTAVVALNGVGYIAGGQSEHIVVVQGDGVLSETDVSGGVKNMVTDDTDLYAIVDSSVKRYDTSIVEQDTASGVKSDLLCVVGSYLIVERGNAQLDFLALSTLDSAFQYRPPFRVGFAIASGSTAVWLFEKDGNGVVYFDFSGTYHEAQLYPTTKANGVRAGYLRSDTLYLVSDGGHKLVVYDVSDVTAISFSSQTEYDVPVTTYYDQVNDEAFVGALGDTPRATLLAGGDATSNFIVRRGGFVDTVSSVTSNYPGSTDATTYTITGAETGGYAEGVYLSDTFAPWDNVGSKVTSCFRADDGYWGVGQDMAWRALSVADGSTGCQAIIPNVGYSRVRVQGGYLGLVIRTNEFGTPTGAAGRVTLRVDFEDSEGTVIGTETISTLDGELCAANFTEPWPNVYFDEEYYYGPLKEQLFLRRVFGTSFVRVPGWIWVPSGTDQIRLVVDTTGADIGVVLLHESFTVTLEYA